MANKIQDKFKKIVRKEYKDYKKNFTTVLKNKVLTNFDNEEDVNGKPFHPLTGTTKKLRREKGTWPGKILNETGKLRKSLKIKTKNEIISIASNVSYAQELNDGREDMKPRKFLEIPDSLSKKGVDRKRLFNEFENKLLQKLEQALIDSGFTPKKG